MSLKNSFAFNLIVIFTIFFAGGCATHRIQMHSTEIQSELDSYQTSKNKVAVMPVAGRIASEQEVRYIQQGLEAYLQYTDEEDNIIRPENVEEILLKRPELIESYQRLLVDVNRIEKNIIANKSDSIYNVDSSPWDGTKGINYDNILPIYKTNNTADLKASKTRINWVIDVKALEYRNVFLPSVKDLAQALNTDYLMIPILMDNYHYRKSLGFIYFLPFMYTYELAHSNDIALFLIDGETGKTVRATIGKNSTPLLVAASMQRTLGKGKFIGKISLKKVDKK